jgi:hypothetical protein
MNQSRRVADLYLGLLAKVLTGTVVTTEPELDAPDFIRSFRDHYVRGEAMTMVPLARLENIRACVDDLIERNVPGDLIETGVWRGGTTIFMRAVLAAHGVSERRVWVADSFEGLPEPNKELFPREARAHASPTMAQDFGHFAVSLDKVRANFEAFGLLDDQVRFLPGWFKDTLFTAPIERLALLRLDGDYYESTSVALNALYDKVSPGGYVVIDDYGEDRWTYCRKAVDDFRRTREITEELCPVDSKCFFWQRRN